MANVIACDVLKERKPSFSVSSLVSYYILLTSSSTQFFLTELHYFINSITLALKAADIVYNTCQM